MSKIDVDRVHDVLEGRIAGRAVGKTFALMTQLLGIVDIGVPHARVVIITHTSQWARMFAKDFSNFLISSKVHHYMMSPYEIHILGSGQQFMVMTADDVILGNKCRGLKLYNHFIDMPGDQLLKYDKRLSTELTSNYCY